MGDTENSKKGEGSQKMEKCYGENGKFLKKKTKIMENYGKF